MATWSVVLTTFAISAGLASSATATSGVLQVNAVMEAPGVVGALGDLALSTFALHAVQPDGTLTGSAVIQVDSRAVC